MTACAYAAEVTPQLWPKEKAWAWYNEVAPIRGVNYVPSYASNEVMIWRDFDADVIDRELG